jgi:hypothetical protein
MTSKPHQSARIDALTRMDGRALESAFARAGAPQASEVYGDPYGRVLHVCGLLATPGITSIVRAVTGSAAFPWEGKSFAGPDGASMGCNRMRIPFRQGVFTFRVYSAHALAIDYDVPQNPWFVRPIYDELRSLGDGLYLGRGMYRRRAGALSLLLWFAVDTSRSSPPLAWR